MFIYFIITFGNVHIRFAHENLFITIKSFVLLFPAIITNVGQIINYNNSINKLFSLECVINKSECYLLSRVELVRSQFLCAKLSD